MRFVLIFVLASFAWSDLALSEVVYIETTLDTDDDGHLDQLFVEIDRPNSSRKLSTIFSISPYALGGSQVQMHSVDVDLLPQDETFDLKANSPLLFQSMSKSHHRYMPTSFASSRYAKVKAHSLGTGLSTGCPSVGGMTETLAAKSVIDWLNGRARGFYKNGTEAKADWANGKVGMTGTSYDGTLPIMVATTGVEGLKAIVPVAAISNWYDYYRANGLVVNPGGFIGEDADILGYYIVRRSACRNVIQNITKIQGREDGDFNSFWQERDYTAQAKNIKAATFIIHGQSDWNVKQKHAIQLWNALDSVAARRMYLHRGGHVLPFGHGTRKKLSDWFDHYLEGIDNGINQGPQVEVELPDGSLMMQDEWPYEYSQQVRFYLSDQETLEQNIWSPAQLRMTDMGQSQRLEDLLQNRTRNHRGRLIFLTPPLSKSRVLSGTQQINLSFSLLNRKAANFSAAIIELDSRGNIKIITRGWADPQNYRSISHGELLMPGQEYHMSFDLEPKQYRLAPQSRLGLVLFSTDYAYTLRPSEGTEIQINVGHQSFLDLRLTPEI